MHTHLVIVAAHHMHVSRYGAQVVVRLLVAHVAGADDLLDLAGHEELAELGRQVVCAEGQMQVTWQRTCQH